METSLHQALKRHYAGDDGPTEVRRGRWRIDACRGTELIEVQHGSLAAIRRKIAALVEDHPVRVVKPLVAEKWIVRARSLDDPPQSRRKSPRRGDWLDLFDELIYFTGLFPHPRLTLEAVLVSVEEWRGPATAPGRRRRRWRRDYETLDQRLVELGPRLEFRTAADLLQLAPPDLPRPFDTGRLAAAWNCHRSRAQRAAYCWLKAGAVRVAGKQGNARLYLPIKRPRRKPRAA